MNARVETSEIAITTKLGELIERWEAMTETTGVGAELGELGA
ncbi:MAG: hypothetical protein ACRBK7_18420 [Acidimicrobiales bacterium]